LREDRSKGEWALVNHFNLEDLRAKDSKKNLPSYLIKKTSFSELTSGQTISLSDDWNGFSGFGFGLCRELSLLSFLVAWPFLLK